MKAVELGYAAGLLDGEGSILVRRQKFLASKRGQRHQLQVSMTNIDKRLCDWMKEHLGGTSYKGGHTSSGSQVWIWQASGGIAAKALMLILPYLIHKREKALLGLEFQAKMRRGHRLSEEEWQWQLNQKALLSATR